MKPTGVQIWSAAPTPLTPELRVDVASVERMVEAAVTEGMHGLFIAGTCGEGPWLGDTERVRLVQAVVKTAAGRLKIAAQVSDNSVQRVVDNAQRMAEAGADYAVIAAPAIFLNATPERITAHFIESAAASPIPVGVYDLGRHRPIVIPEAQLKEVYLQPNVHLVKDSSGAPERRAAALAARAAKPSLRVFNGDEFRCIEYLVAGYDGFMFGGAAAVAPQLHQIVQLVTAGKLEEARQVEAAMTKTLYGIYGGEKIACWLTGLKHYMVRRGLFSSTASYLGYPLNEETRSFIERYVAAAPAVSAVR